jgi:hypothetical protein
MARPPGRPKLKTQRSSSIGDSDASSSSNDEKGGSNSNSNSAATNFSYTPPIGLFGNEKLAPKFFRIPIPPVPSSVQSAVQSYLTHGGAAPIQPRKSLKSIKQLAQVKQLQHESKGLKQKVKLQKIKLDQALQIKERGLQDIRKLREEGMEQAMVTVEQTLRAQHDKNSQEQDDKLNKRVTEEFEQEFEKDLEQKRKERQEKRKEMEDQPAAKKPKTTDDEQEEGPKKSEFLEQTEKDNQANLDRLTETKSEMVWLLKQVIKAETKRKMVEVMRQKAAVLVKR